MPNPIHLLFGIHCHQPVGNFDHVLEQEFQRAYAPFLLVAEEFPELLGRCEMACTQHLDIIHRLENIMEWEKELKKNDSKSNG